MTGAYTTTTRDTRARTRTLLRYYQTSVAPTDRRRLPVSKEKERAGRSVPPTISHTRACERELARVWSTGATGYEKEKVEKGEKAGNGGDVAPRRCPGYMTRDEKHSEGSKGEKKEKHERIKCERRREKKNKRDERVKER